jgi:hypothetical protein
MALTGCSLNADVAGCGDRRRLSLCLHNRVLNLEAVGCGLGRGQLYGDSVAAHQWSMEIGGCMGDGNGNVAPAEKRLQGNARVL